MSAREITIEIRDCNIEDKQAWRRLYDGYPEFYKGRMSDEVADTVWNWLQDPAHDLNCILAVHKGDVVGLAHYRRMLRPLKGCYIGYLDDLFVAPAARGLNVGEAIFAALDDISQKNGWQIMRWLTADDNYRARSLYDKHSKKSHFNLYEMTVGN